MNLKRPLMALSSILFLVSLTACATVPFTVGGDFNRRQRNIAIRVPKYEPSRIDTSIFLNLLPQDVVINVDLYFKDFGEKTGINFIYDNTSQHLMLTFDLKEEYTLVPQHSDVSIKITYLSYRELNYYEGSGSPRRRHDVYEIQHKRKILRYKATTSELNDKCEIIHRPNKGISEAVYMRLFREICALQDGKRKVLIEKVDDDFIERIKKPYVRRYVESFRSAAKSLDL